MPAVTGGLVWRVFSDRPDESGTFKLIREDRGANPEYRAAARQLRDPCRVGPGQRGAAGDPEGGNRSRKLHPSGRWLAHGRPRRRQQDPANQISFSIYKGSQFEATERAPLVPNVLPGDLVLLPEGTYYIVSNYGDANSVVRSDIRVQAGKLIDVTMTHRAAVITLKLVSDKGGEALANTAWSVITPGGDVVKESVGAFPRMVLSEGEYRAIAKNEGKVYERPFNVVNGVDGDVEVLAR